MKITPLTRSSMQTFIDAVDRVTPESQRQWGTLDPHRMIAHLIFTLDMSLGKHQVDDHGNILTHTSLFRWLIFEIMPWPKGKIKAPPELTPAPSNDFETDRRLLKERIAEFAEVLEKEPARKTRNPIFGPLPLSIWSRIHGRHTAWHMQQFSTM